MCLNLSDKAVFSITLQFSQPYIFYSMTTTRFARLLLVFLGVSILSLPTILQAQRDEDGEKTRFKGSPAKIIQEADDLYYHRQFTLAEEAYRAALIQEPDNFHATYRVGKCNKILQNYDEAVRWFESALELDPNGNDTAYFELGTSYKYLERYNDALEVFEKFKKRYTVTDEYSKRVGLEIESCKWAPAELEKIPEYMMKSLDFNTEAGDMFPSKLLQNDADSFIVFTSHRSESQGNDFYEGLGEASFSDLWIVKMEDDSTFGVAENLGKKINTKKNDGTSAFSPDGLTVYFSICNSGKLGYGCSIYKSEYDPDKKAWGKPVMVEGINGTREVVVNSRGKTKKVPTWDAQPSLSKDGNTMFFVSNREGGWGKLDIWYSVREGEEWSEPINAGPEINTPFDDKSPFISHVTDRLYFASDGRVGFGGDDIYYSDGSPGNWGDPVNMGIPINSSYDDFGGIWMQGDSLTLFTSNRPGGMGRDDIYWAKRNPEPPLTVTVHGMIRDKRSQKPVPFAEAMLFEIDEEGQLVPVDTFKTDQSALYNFNLELDKDYKIVGNAPEYLANDVQFSTRDLKPDPEAEDPYAIDFEYNIDIRLERIEINKPIVLNNIYYDFDMADLRPKSIEELNKLYDIMKWNKNITIKIGSHTDSNGTESYNKDLANKRAKSVVEYLLGKEVDPDRLTWFGFGESQLLIYPELSDQDEQYNRRSEFRIMSMDYEPAE